ncbi:Alkylglycerol monooxygenase, partial [Galemys pyrenaicus]
VINNLGPLELILNTPSHHRVHHGRNRYCIDKNYAGTLIIWDRIFGTFEAENEKVAYGLTHPINTFEPFKVQFHHLISIWTTFWATPGFFNKFSVILKGPGWGPGKPRLGLSEEIPEITGKEVPFSSSASQLLQIYAVVQFALMLAFYEETFANKAVLSQVSLLLRVCFIILTLTSIGFLLDQRPKGAVLETFRCLMCLMVCRYGHLISFIPSLSFALE